MKSFLVRFRPSERIIVPLVSAVIQCNSNLSMINLLFAPFSMVEKRSFSRQEVNVDHEGKQQPNISS